MALATPVSRKSDPGPAGSERSHPAAVIRSTSANLLVDYARYNENFVLVVTSKWLHPLKFNGISRAKPLAS
jgi:hypothetical protein